MWRRCLGWPTAKGKVQPEISPREQADAVEDSGKLGGLLRGISCSYLSHEFLQEVQASGRERSSPVYEVEADVIRKKGEHLICPRDQRLGTAYVDAVTDAAAGKSEYMLSYSWAYPVGDIADTLSDFFGSTDLHQMFIWICCLCINQHRVKEAKAKGEVVSFSEFKEAFGQRVAGVSHILAMMSPWNEPRYIRRVWCVYEFSVAMKEQKQLSVLMPPAEEESFRASLFQCGLQGLYDVLASLRIQDASASVEEDKINILKTIDPDAADYNESPKVGSLNASVRRRIQAWLIENAADWLEKKIQEEEDKTELSVYNSVGSLLIDSVADFPRAEKLLSSGLRKHPDESLDSAMTLRLLGRLAVRKGQWDEAYKLYADSKSRLENLQSTKTVQYAQVLVDLFTTTAQEAFLQTAHRLFESLNAITHEDYPRVLKHIGSIKLQSGNVTEAMELFQLSAQSYEKLKLQRSPGYADLYTNIGKAHVTEGKHHEALADYQTAGHVYSLIGVTESPGYADLLVNLGMLHIDLGRFEEAMMKFSQARAIYEDVGSQGTTMAELWAQIGRCNLDAQRRKEAMEAFRKAKGAFEACGERKHPTYEMVIWHLERNPDETQGKPPGRGIWRGTRRSYADSHKRPFKDSYPIWKRDDMSPNL